MSRLRTALAALPARQLHLIAAGVVAIAALLAWSLALRAPLAAYRQQGLGLAALRASAAATAAVPAMAVPVVAAPPAAPTPLALTAAISRSATVAGVDVLAAAEGASATVAGLRQQTLHITAAGSYAAVLAWLDDIERSQGAVAIVQLELQPEETGPRRKATLQLAIYSPP